MRGRSGKFGSPVAACLALGVLIAAAQHAGCAGDSPGLIAPTTSGSGGAGGEAPQVNVGEEMFRELEEELLSNCGACHELGGSADTPFLGARDDGEDPYIAITSWPGIVVEKADTSVLLTWPRVGQHTGGPTNPQLEAKLDAWLQEEAKSVAEIEGEVLIIPPFRPIIPGFNAVYLDALGTAYAGMAVTFLAEELTGSSLSLTSMQIHPTIKKGISVEHPLFTVYPAGSDEGNPDPVDSFSNVTQDVEPGSSQELGPGTLVLTNWVSGGKLSIAFEAVSSIDPLGMGGAGGGGPVGPCSALQSFIDNASGPLGNCTGCHGGTNQTATNAVDMSALGTDPDATCGQILNRVDVGNPAASQLFLTTDPNGNAGHPFKFGGDVGNFNTFVSAVSVWIQQEAP